MKITLRLDYHAPNPANVRQHWRARTKEKHRAQDALLCALRSAAASSSTLTPSMEPSKTYSTACDTLASYTATKRVKSRSKSIKSA